MGGIRSRAKLGWRVFGAILASAVLTLALPTAAGAWTQPANTQWGYWSPGPPPGSSNYNECYVTTGNGIAFNYPYGQIYPLYGYGSYCVQAGVELFWGVGGNDYETGPAYGFQNAWEDLFPAGGAGYGGDVLGVEYCSWDVTYIEECWEAGWLG
jgi:hypothetical protein